MVNDLNAKSTLEAEDLSALGTELSLRQIQNSLFEQNLQIGRVAEPGSPAFAFGVTQAEMLLTSLRAAQLPIAA